jgi:hypothetical protein
MDPTLILGPCALQGSNVPPPFLTFEETGFPSSFTNEVSLISCDPCRCWVQDKRNSFSMARWYYTSAATFEFTPRRGAQLTAAKCITF